VRAAARREVEVGDVDEAYFGECFIGQLAQAAGECVFARSEKDTHSSVLADDLICQTACFRRLRGRQRVGGEVDSAGLDAEME
jgi:hypothetical protein